MTLQQLVCFCETARRGSFNAAARALALSQPAVSEQVRRLEGELGAALVRREGRGVTLTAEGSVFLAHAERLVAGAQEAASSVGPGSASGGGLVVLGLTRNAPHYPVDELVASFAAEHPDIRVRLPGHNSFSVAEAVRSGELDAAIVILPVDPHGLDVRPLFRDEVLFVSRDPERTRAAVDVEHLASAPLILYDAGHGFQDPTRRQLAARAQEAGVTLLPRYDVEHAEMALQLAARGLGDTIAARAVTHRPWFPPDLRTAHFADPLYDHFAIVTRTGPPPPPGLRRLLLTVEAWGAEMHGRLAVA